MKDFKKHFEGKLWSMLSDEGANAVLQMERTGESHCS